MQAALALARRGLGNTAPNPTVGCVIVAAGGQVAGRGWTQPGGRPHAETEALKRAGARARGGTAYVTLEPCCHWGRTPPCTDALIAAGIARVVLALRDPDPRVDGGGIARLRQAGIAVEEGVAESEARALNLGFLTCLAAARPMLTLKLASTLDGRIATRSGESRWITGTAARRAAHALRGRHDAILVGAGTVLADDPALDCRIAGFTSRPALKVVADGRRRTPPGARLFASPGASLIATRADATGPDLPGEVLHVAPAPDGAGVDLTALLEALAARGVTRVLAEGGAALAASLLRAGLVDRLAWFHAPALLGADALPALQALRLDSLAAMPRFRLLATTPLGPPGRSPGLGTDLLSEYEPA